MMDSLRKLRRIPYASPHLYRSALLKMCQQLVGWASIINGDDVFVVRGNKPFAAFVVIIGDVTVVALVVGVVFVLLLLLMLHDVISLITRTTDGK